MRRQPEFAGANSLLAQKREANNNSPFQNLVEREQHTAQASLLTGGSSLPAAFPALRPVTQNAFSYPVTAAAPYGIHTRFLFSAPLGRAAPAHYSIRLDLHRETKLHNKIVKPIRFVNTWGGISRQREGLKEFLPDIKDPGQISAEKKPPCRMALSL